MRGADTSCGAGPAGLGAGGGVIGSPRSSAVPGQPPQTAPHPQARLFPPKRLGPGAAL